MSKIKKIKEIKPKITSVKEIPLETKVKEFSKEEKDLVELESAMINMSSEASLSPGLRADVDRAASEQERQIEDRTITQQTQERQTVTATAEEVYKTGRDLQSRTTQYMTSEHSVKASALNRPNVGAQFSMIHDPASLPEEQQAARVRAQFEKRVSETGDMTNEYNVEERPASTTSRPRYPWER